ncbi:protein of unknown function [Paraburkholderia kururiensis]
MPLPERHPARSNAQSLLCSIAMRGAYSVRMHPNVGYQECTLQPLMVRFREAGVTGSGYAIRIARMPDTSATIRRRVLDGLFWTFDVVRQFVDNLVDPLFCEPHGKRTRSNQPGYALGPPLAD